MSTKALQLEQLDQKFSQITSIMSALQPPTKGWIRAIRTTLGMTLRQLGQKLDLPSQSVADYENREVTGSITLEKMKTVAEAMDMHFVYALVPKDGSLKALIDRKATEIAQEIVERTSLHMRLEDQEVSYKRVQKAKEERKQDIIEKMPKYLWD